VVSSAGDSIVYDLEQVVLDTGLHVMTRIVPYVFVPVGMIVRPSLIMKSF
jgi:hypothetical protein